MKNACFLFSEVRNKTPFDGCISGPQECTCSQEHFCITDSDNVIRVIPNIEEVETTANGKFNVISIIHLSGGEMSNTVQ